MYLSPKRLAHHADAVGSGPSRANCGLSAANKATILGLSLSASRCLHNLACAAMLLWLPTLRQRRSPANGRLPVFGRQQPCQCLGVPQVASKRPSVGECTILAPSGQNRMTPPEANQNSGASKLWRAARAELLRGAPAATGDGKFNCNPFFSCFSKGPHIWHFHFSDLE